jgi:hypothetical protein
MGVPILLNHDPEKIIGKVEAKGDFLIVEFFEGSQITRDKMFDIFGNIIGGLLEWVVIEEKFYIKKMCIHSFSLGSDVYWIKEEKG